MSDTIKPLLDLLEETDPEQAAIVQLALELGPRLQVAARLLANMEQTIAFNNRASEEIRQTPGPWDHYSDSLRDTWATQRWARGNTLQRLIDKAEEMAEGHRYMVGFPLELQ